MDVAESLLLKCLHDRGRLEPPSLRQTFHDQNKDPTQHTTPLDCRRDQDLNVKGASLQLSLSMRSQSSKRSDQITSRVSKNESKLVELRGEILNRRRLSSELRANQMQRAKTVLATRRRRNDIAAFEMSYKPDAACRPSDREYVIRVYSLRDKLCREQAAFRAWFNKFAGGDDDGIFGGIADKNPGYSLDHKYMSTRVHNFDGEEYAKVLRDRETLNKTRNRGMAGSKIFPKSDPVFTQTEPCMMQVLAVNKDAHATT